MLTSVTGSKYWRHGMLIDTAQQVMTYRKEPDPETGQYYVEVILRGRLGPIAGVLEKLLANNIIPDAERLDRQGLDAYRILTEAAEELRNDT
jgi:hypothetical protein